MIRGRYTNQHKHISFSDMEIIALTICNAATIAEIYNFTRISYSNNSIIL